MQPGATQEMENRASQEALGAGPWPTAEPRHLGVRGGCSLKASLSAQACRRKLGG